MAISERNVAYHQKPSKASIEFNKLLPSDGFCVLKPDDFKKMMKIIHNEQNKVQQHVYFTKVLDKMFASGWGWYMRLGESLSAMPRYKYPSQLPESKRADALAVLRMVKAMHIELHYNPNYISVINQYIRDFGGHTLTREQVVQQSKAKFAAAARTLAAGEKLPRKQKKAIKAQSRITKTR